MKWVIVPNSGACMGKSDGELSVAVVEIADDGTEVHDSCWLTLDAAAARISELESGGVVDIVLPEYEYDPEDLAAAGTTVKVDVVIDGMNELERAAALADKVRDTLGLLSEMKVEGQQTFDSLLDDSIEFGAIESHSTSFSDDPWDGPATETRVSSPNEEGYYAAIYAWRDDEADTSVKAAYRFIHHFVSEDGDPGAASIVACSTGIGVLNGARGGTTIPASDREGVYNHLARHLRDAERVPPELMSQDDYEAALAHANAELAEELDTPSSEGGLGGLSDEDLIAELARRWADGLAERVKSDPVEATADDDAEFGAPLVEIEVEIKKGEGEEEEGEGGGEQAMWCCEMSGEVLPAPCEVCPHPDRCQVPMGYSADEEALTVDDAVEAAEAEIAEITEAPIAVAFDWEGVLIVEGMPSGDGRMVAEGALTWRELPIPLMLQTVNAAGHDGAVIAGSIHEIVREGQNIMGRGYFDSGDAGQEARRLLSEGTMRGVSADIDSVIVDFRTPDGEEAGVEDVMFGADALEVLTAGRIMGATLTPFPAFQEAFVQVMMGDEIAEDPALVASGAVLIEGAEVSEDSALVRGDVWRVPSRAGVWMVGDESAAGKLEALVASAGSEVEVPVNPSREWFMPGEMTEPTPFTVHPDGRCYGLVAQWGSCHIGFTDRCQQVPKSGSAYKHFRNKTVLTAEGELVATGPIFMDTVHPNLRLVASDAQAHYADTGCAVADVALYENEFGIVAAGALRPGLSPEQVRRFRGSDVSPDWRTIGGRLEVVGLLSVNVSGFVVESSLVASGGTPTARGMWDSTVGEVTALVAAGMIHKSETQMESLRRELADLSAQVAELREAVRPMRAERAAAALSQIKSFGAAPVCGCGGEGACGCA
jgi:hypothetical protein